MVASRSGFARFRDMLRTSALSILLSLPVFASAFAGDKPADAPDGMVWIPGGEFSMGAAVEWPWQPRDADGFE